MTKMLMMLRTAAIAALLLFGLVGVAPAVAQDATPPADSAVQEVEDTTEEVTEDDDGGFEWGLLGLLGLAGLAGLLRKAPQPVVHDTDRTGTRTTGSDTLR
jgi:MYXO-CTERM domain-containing protein